jgi:maleate isomerase
VLRTGYGVRAQMLGPVLRREALAGWLSVHSGHEREWSTSDLAALDEAVTATRDELDRIDRVGGLAGYPD